MQLQVESPPMSPDLSKYFEDLISVYTDNIRASDFKSNVLIFFLSISISTVAAFRPELPRYIPMLLLLLLPVCSIILLILSLAPRFIAIPGYPFYLRRSMSPEAFVTPPEDVEDFLALLRYRCASLANILYWKIILFRIAIGICLFYLAALVALALGGGLRAVAL
jgi:hypothetical protein